MNILIILFLIFYLIYIHFGLFVLIQIIIWTIVFFLSNFLVGINRTREMKIIRILSILVIVFILYYNSITNNILSSFIIPLSINQITFVKDVFRKSNDSASINYFENAHITWFKFWDKCEVKDFIELLDYNKAYLVSFELILDMEGFEQGDPTLLISSPILISKDSNPKLISKFISKKAISACYNYNLYHDIAKEAPSILVKYKEINLFWK